MPPPKSRNMCIILFDLKAGCPSSALHALSEVILYNRLAQSNDHYKLYLVNAAMTGGEQKYQGIHYLDAGIDLGSLLQEIVSVSPGQADWLEALDIAVEELKENFEGPGIISLQILFITDLGSFERPNNGKLLEKLIQDINNYDMFLYVIGPPINPPKTIVTDGDISQWMNSLEVAKDKSNLKIMKKIVTKTPHSVMCNYDVGVHLFHSLKYSKGMQAWKVPLTFGTLLNLPVSTIRLTKREPPFGLKRTTKRISTTQWAYEDQQNVVLDYTDTVSGLIKHGKFVKIESDGKFKVEGPRSFQALGFTEAKNVPEYLLQSDGSYLVVQTQSDEYLHFFTTLVQELINQDLYILARRVYNKDFNPKFCALIPRYDYDTPEFILCQIPYADDIAHVYNEQTLESAPKVVEDKNVFNFLDSIDVSQDKCQIEVPLAPSMMIYSTALNIINKVEEKVIDEALLERKVDKPIMNELNLEYLKNEWPINKVEEVKREEKAISDFDDVDDFDFS